MPSGRPNLGDTVIPGTYDPELFVKVCKREGWEGLPDKVEEKKGRGETGVTTKAPQSKNDPLGELHAVQFGCIKTQGATSRSLKLTPR